MDGEDQLPGDAPEGADVEGEAVKSALADDAGPVEVSIIVPTIDRHALLKRAIASLMNQRNPAEVRCELIVVDNGPEALSREPVKALAAGSPMPVRWVHEPRTNISRARNAGIAAARGAFIAFLDDDCEADPDWLTEMLTTLKDTGADLVSGPIEHVFEGGAPPAWDRHGILLCLDFELPTGTPITHTKGGHMMFRRSTCVTGAEPFDPAMAAGGADDYDFVQSVLGNGRTAVWCATARVFEFVPENRLSLQYRARRTFVFGQRQVRVRMKHSPLGPVIAVPVMAKAAMQAAVYGVRLAAAWMLGRGFDARLYLRVMAGLGKLAWPLGLHHR